VDSCVAEGRWRNDVPIYRQLRDRIADMILEGGLAEGDALPSVREVAAEHRVNPLTVLKGYQLLVEQQIVESRRGRGMFVLPGARDRLLALQRAEFLGEQWPQIRAKVERLGLDWDELLRPARHDRKKT
jgi:GntR family transcriptional regulator